jgi:predicted acyltransferase
MIAAAAILCVGYWIVMTQVPTPAGVRGDLTPNGNWGAFIDRAVFGSHLWSSSRTWDPEGLLSTVPAIATALLGIACGTWLASDAAPSRKAAMMAIAGGAAMALGYAWHPFFPINKNLWTSSFVLFTAGFAALALAACYWAIDVRGWRGWTKPFVILGTNAITLYAASALLVETMGLIRMPGGDGRTVGLSHWIYTHLFQPFAPPKVASLEYAIANLLVMFALLAWMYRRRLFLRV